jgi:hypothetical protein
MTAGKIVRETPNAKLSALWTFVMVNILAADIFSFMLAGQESEPLSAVTPAMMLAFAAVLEIPVAMIFLSRILKPRANRAVNLAACAVTILFVIAGGSLTPHYVFFASMEIIAMLWIARCVWKRDGSPEPAIKESRRTRKSSSPCSAILNAEIWDFWSATDLRSALTREKPPAIMMVSTAMTRTAIGIANPRRSVEFFI